MIRINSILFLFAIIFSLSLTANADSPLNPFDRNTDSNIADPSTIAETTIESLEEEGYVEIALAEASAQLTHCVGEDLPEDVHLLALYQESEDQSVLKKEFLLYENIKETSTGATSGSINRDDPRVPTRATKYTNTYIYHGIVTHSTDLELTWECESDQFSSRKREMVSRTTGVPYTFETSRRNKQTQILSSSNQAISTKTHNTSNSNGSLKEEHFAEKFDSQGRITDSYSNIFSRDYSYWGEMVEKTTCTYYDDTDDQIRKIDYDYKVLDCTEKWFETNNSELPITFDVPECGVHGKVACEDENNELMCLGECVVDEKWPSEDSFHCWCPIDVRFHF